MRWLLAGAYAIATVAIVVAVGSTLGREIFPSSGAHLFQLRFRAPAGTMFENTERLASDVLDEIKIAAGPTNVDITLGYVGVQPSSYPINTIFLWTGGSHEGVMQVALKPEAPIRLADFEEDLRRRFTKKFPDAQVEDFYGGKHGRISLEHKKALAAVQLRRETKVAEGKESRVIAGREYLLELPLRADFAFVWAWKADTWGNLLYRKTTRNFAPMMCAAAKVTVAEAPSVVAAGELDPDLVQTPSIYVKRVVKGEKYEKWIERRTVRPRAK